jgi:hypothetical protein
MVAEEGDEGDVALSVASFASSNNTQEFNFGPAEVGVDKGGGAGGAGRSKSSSSSSASLKSKMGGEDQDFDAMDDSSDGQHKRILLFGRTLVTTNIIISDDADDASSLVPRPAKRQRTKTKQTPQRLAFTQSREKTIKYPPLGSSSGKAAAPGSSSKKARALVVAEQSALLDQANANRGSRQSAQANRGDEQIIIFVGGCRVTTNNNIRHTPLD